MVTYQAWLLVPLRIIATILALSSLALALDGSWDTRSNAGRAVDTQAEVLAVRRKDLGKSNTIPFDRLTCH